MFILYLKKIPKRPSNIFQTSFIKIYEVVSFLLSLNLLLKK